MTYLKYRQNFKYFAHWHIKYNLLWIYITTGGKNLIKILKLINLVKYKKKSHRNYIKCDNYRNIHEQHMQAGL